MVERHSCKVKVVGSIPIEGIKKLMNNHIEVLSSDNKVTTNSKQVKTIFLNKNIIVVSIKVL